MYTGKSLNLGNITPKDFHFHNHNPSFIESIYLSAVTITTLGYGDIHPITNYGRILTIIESIIGIIIIGVFLNSLWYHYGKSVEIMNKAQLEQILKQKNDYRLKTYYRYLSSMINLYKWSFAELTTPIEFRGNTSLRINQIFTFSDLKDL